MKKKVCKCEISKNEVLQRIKGHIYVKKDWREVENIYVGYIDHEQFGVSYKRAINIDKNLFKLVDYSPAIIKGVVKEEAKEVFIEYVYTKKTSIILLAIWANLFAVPLFGAAILGVYENFYGFAISLIMSCYIFGMSYLMLSVKKSEKQRLEHFLECIRR